MKKKPARAAKVPPLFLVTEANEKIGRTRLRAGMFDNPDPAEELAYAADDIGYYLMSTNNGRYLHLDRLWPITANPKSAIERDPVWGGYHFRLVELGASLSLAEPAAWQALLDAGLRLKPKKKDQPSLLEWPAMKGHVEVLRLLLDAGADPGHDDVVMAAAAFQQRATAKLLVDRGFDGKQAVVTMQRYKNDGALAILRELGFS